MRFVVDASIAFEYLLRTKLGRAVAQTLESATLFAPELLDAEVLAVLRKAVLGGLVDEKRAEQVLDDLRDWDVLRLPHGSLIHDAWTFRHSVTAYDALYLAAAKRYDAAVITADGPLSRAPVSGVVIQNVRG